MKQDATESAATADTEPAVSSERRFPIIRDKYPRDERELAMTLPCNVPWALVAPHEAQARRNHGQSLNRLAERGGLSVCELLAVLEDRPWQRIALPVAILRLREIVGGGDR